jgi:protein-S-isoprenylcysteine O-methyltransferase Ste14
MDSYLRIYLPIYLLMYLAVAFILPSYRIWKQTGINPVTFGKEDTAHNYVGFIMKLLTACLFISVLIYSFSKDLYLYLLPAWYLETQAVRMIGLVLVHLALVWIVVAQHQMSTSWRIGIDERSRTELKTTGLFRLSRNPIFLGIIVSVLGLFLIMPNALTFSLVIATYFIIQIQIRLEEEFLDRQHGKAYKEYKSKTRRLI